MGLRDDTGQSHIGCSRKDKNNRAQLFTGSYSYRTRDAHLFEMLINIEKCGELADGSGEELWLGLTS